MAGKRLYTLNEEIFNQIDSKEKAYWFGFYVQMVVYIKVAQINM